ncbi:hypothetical protein BPAE_0028g00660 [Botrytis paeoniae]|uniref:Uncharacterized protein n=1 Tax=Botrytis paeoniae TaxID=278948 RepID=A0A4Z1G2W0_9HELO|nr:hypothetical protein BPAE_0028g00660 [Botrytis paeoniae]
MITPSYDPKTDAIDAWSSDSNAFPRNLSDPGYPGSLDPNTIQIPDPPSSTLIPTIPDIPPPISELPMQNGRKK